MTDYAPAKLDRQGDDGPFKGLSKQALVFLGGDSYHGGENYVYKVKNPQRGSIYIVNGQKMRMK